MADVRALMAAERQSRRIVHPQLTYTKSGMLMCNICHLNVKSESLWEGHLRSANHRKNTLASQENTSKGLKRKIDDVEESWNHEEDGDVEGRKKTKSRVGSIVEASDSMPSDHELRSVPSKPETTPLPASEGEDDQEISRSRTPTIENTDARNIPPVASTFNEDEWAAFEAEVVPLAHRDYSSATISAAPVSTRELEAQVEVDRRKKQEIEADDENEEEQRRLEDEFDVMEEMEEKIRRLREQREALRTKIQDGEVSQQESTLEKDEDIDKKRQSEDDGSEDDTDEVDDWYT